jgi:hypothetical protein
VLGLQPQKDAASAPCAAARLYRMAADGRPLVIAGAGGLSSHGVKLHRYAVKRSGRPDDHPPTRPACLTTMPASLLITPKPPPGEFAVGGRHRLCRLCPAAAHRMPGLCPPGLPSPAPVQPLFIPPSPAPAPPPPVRPQGLPKAVKRKI